MDMLMLKSIRVRLLLCSLELQVLNGLEAFTQWRIRKIGQKVLRAYAETIDMYASME